MKIVGKFLLLDDWNIQNTLLIKVSEDQQIHYSLSRTKNREEQSISTLKLDVALPEVMLDYKNVTEMLNCVSEAIRSGVKKIETVVNYQKET